QKPAGQSTSASSASESASPSASTEATTEAPFHPPATLAELDKQTEWEDRPVRDSLKLFAEDRAKQPELVIATQALAMKNGGPEDNKKILSALSRLPQDNQQPDWNGSITRYLIMDMNSMNPILVDTAYEMWVAQIYVPYIIAYDWNMKP